MISALPRIRHAGNDTQPRRQVRNIQGFKAYTLATQDLRITVVPELGARIISLKDLRTGREWLWHPAVKRNLFRNRAGDSFESSPLVGLDECLPTIAPCVWQQRKLPDHGEVWAAAWTVDRDAWGRGLVRTNVGLKISPLDFERTIELNENEVRLRYRLENRSATEEHYLWAMHPLLRLQSGDKLELPFSTRALLNGAAGLNALNSSETTEDCEKTFASPISDGWAAISNRETGDRLHFEWDSAENNTLGLWLNRGGWHGHHHFALEPANGKTDLLTVAAQRKCCGSVAARASVTWQVSIRVGN
jgi:galactose mutarotase-like enzyme